MSVLGVADLKLMIGMKKRRGIVWRRENIIHYGLLFAASDPAYHCCFSAWGLDGGPQIWYRCRDILHNTVQYNKKSMKPRRHGACDDEACSVQVWEMHEDTQV